jgi:hypothetical protein
VTPLAQSFVEAARVAREQGDHRSEGCGFVDGVQPFEAPTLKRYFADPEFRAQHDAETQSWRDRTNALIDAGMRRAREKREAGK